jgi:RNA polymerase-binding transcription factor DksA
MEKTEEYRMNGIQAAVARNVLVALRSFLSSEAELLADAAHDLAMESRPRVAALWRGSRLPWDIQDAENLASFIHDLLRRRLGTIDRIDLALERLVDGTYGVCLACKSPIPPSWLVKVPYADRCERCRMDRRTDRHAVEPERRDAFSAPRTKACHNVSHEGRL